MSLSVSEGVIPMLLLLLLRVEETQRLVLGVTDGLLLCLESFELLPQEVELLLIVVLLSLQTLYHVFLSRLKGSGTYRLSQRDLQHVIICDGFVPHHLVIVRV